MRGSDCPLIGDMELEKVGKETDPLIQSVYVNVQSDEESGSDEPISRWESCKQILPCFRRKTHYARTIELANGTTNIVSKEVAFAKNEVRNQKYSLLSFVPVVLIEQFQYFFNFYFLVVALSQFIPILQVGYLFTYVAPLLFVLSVTMAKEAYDDIQRWRRDKEANSQMFYKLMVDGSFEEIASSDIQLGDIIKVHKNERIPADMLLLKTTEQSGASFIRTDQLDGETDWKLRRAITATQALSETDILSSHFSIQVSKPKKDIHTFAGVFRIAPHHSFQEPSHLERSHHLDSSGPVEGLSIENTMWMNTVLATGTALGLVIYTGADTRSVMNTSVPDTKVGILDIELNSLSKLLCCLVLLLSFVMVAMNEFKSGWVITGFRFCLLFSSIIPISLRVNLDMGKVLYSLFIMRDEKIEGTIVRTSTIPEELGRISYLLSDKTGTLTQNIMIFKKLHIGVKSISSDDLSELKDDLEKSFTEPKLNKSYSSDGYNQIKRANIRTIIEAMALCHNVTPTREDPDQIAYQASSPDEEALVKFTESVGLVLWERSLFQMVLKDPLGELREYEVLHIFPFTSESKRMGIIVREAQTGRIVLYVKGADVIMAKLVKENDWLAEETSAMARQGLRTLVYGMRVLTVAEYEAFTERLGEAASSVKQRDARVQVARSSIESDLELLGITGVEDRLQDDVRQTLELLRHAGIRVWMLTGDKVETATNIAISARLIAREHVISTVLVGSKDEATERLEQCMQLKEEQAIIIDGRSLALCLEHCPDLFITLACSAAAVVCCRCSPTQKASIVTLIQQHTKKRTCAIGDGGNDVSMIQAADVGIGIVGKEGRQASLAADFSINKFCYIARLIIWHGRNSYKRSASLGQFVIHRGIIISFIQAVFSALFYFAAVAVYNGWLLVGYATVFTNFIVFSIVLDHDVTEEVAFQYPELYKDLQKGRSLSYKTFFMWIFKTTYQGAAIMLVALFLFDSSMYNIVSITFTALILTECVNVAMVIHTWHWIMVACEILTLSIYFLAMVILKSYFDLNFITSWDFIWKVVVITAVATVPIFIGKILKRKFDPPAYAKLS